LKGARRVPSQAWKYRIIGVALIALAAGCGPSVRHQTAPSTTRVSAPPTTAVAGVQASGPRTVLSPLGINVRARAVRSAPVLGTAAWGNVLTVLGHTTANGGWFEVRGATHTGWISGDPRLSAPGEFLPYTSNVFAALYPPTWTHKASPVAGKPPRPAGVVFTSGSGADSISVATATSASQLPRGRTGYGESASRSTVVCGVTSDLVTYTRSGATPPQPYLLQLRLTLDAHHAMGFEANLSNLAAPLQVFSNFLASVTFPFPQCTGK
jgi:hypothetical protein